jgi:sterol O-acyltransferase
MSSSADIHVNGNGNAHHEHILRPRAVKPANPAVLRTMSEEGLTAAESPQNGSISGQTRDALSSLDTPTQLTSTVDDRHRFLQMRLLQCSRYPRLENSSELSSGADYFQQ